VYSSQAEETILLSMLDVLPGCRHPEDHTCQDKHGLLQGLRNMQSGVPGSGYHHGVVSKGPIIVKENQQSQYSIAGR
jgi:hypothetical protein